MSYLELILPETLEGHYFISITHISVHGTSDSAEETARLNNSPLMWNAEIVNFFHTI